MSKATIVSYETGRVVAEIDTDLKSGTDVKFGYYLARESLNANYDYVLVNDCDGWISRAKKRFKENCVESAELISEFRPDFYICHDDSPSLRAFRLADKAEGRDE